MVRQRHLALGYPPLSPAPLLGEIPHRLDNLPEKARCLVGPEGRSFGWIQLLGRFAPEPLDELSRDGDSGRLCQRLPELGLGLCSRCCRRGERQSA